VELSACARELVALTRGEPIELGLEIGKRGALRTRVTLARFGVGLGHGLELRGVPARELLELGTVLARGGSDGIFSRSFRLGVVETSLGLKLGLFEVGPGLLLRLIERRPMALDELLAFRAQRTLGFRGARLSHRALGREVLLEGLTRGRRCRSGLGVGVERLL